ncbi:MAG TPA: PIG-L deacetylase family protein [Bryobacteraceae bacterium]|nr:PIG-L deacetylase family protein [Bryobacteraceae bacterium]
MPSFSRRNFLALAAAAAQAARAQTRPYEGRSLVVITAHADDFTIFAGGTIAKLIDQGYTGHLIRVTNDEKDSYDLDLGETSHRNTVEMREAARILGINDVHSLDFRNDEMDAISETEVRARLILWFRKLKPWTIFTFDPSAKYEENPDHKKTARAAEDAAWTAQGHLFLEEQFTLGLNRWAVLDRYYWARAPENQDVNKVVDISATIDRKIRAVQAHKTMMRHTAYSLKEKLAEAHLRLPLLDTINEESVNRLIEIETRETAAAVGRKHGMQYAEFFHYIPIAAENSYVMKNAVPLK